MFCRAGRIPINCRARQDFPDSIVSDGKGTYLLNDDLIVGKAQLC